ncbi:MAG: hypothetical protein ABI954_04145 [Pyrinomonadaceae bacterium]
METEIYSTHPVARAIISGTAPAQARIAAAKGILPLPNNDLLEVLVHLAQDKDTDLAGFALETFIAQENILGAVTAEEVAPSVLGFVASRSNSFDRLVYEAVLTNAKTPDEAIIKFVSNSTDGSLLELATLNQQRLIRTPAILDAILANSARTFEAERRAQETRQEFFEKSRGAEQIAAEFRAQGNTAAAEFLEQAEFSAGLADEPTEGQLSIEDVIFLAQHIEVPDDEIDDSWFAFDLIEELYEETEEQRRVILEKIINESALDGEAIPERLAMIRRIMLMGIKDRIKMAMKGDREARSILIRDSNKLIAKAVLMNPRITDNEVERIAAMRTAADEILRLIGISRAWTRSYTIIHNLARNPRTPLGTAMHILPRIQTKDLKAIAGNRNVSEAVRKQASRMLSMRK